MHPLFPKADGLTRDIIGAAVEVHRDKGPGLVESIYEWCLSRELELRRLSTIHQKVVKITYKGFTKEEPLRFDMLVEECVLIEAKSVERVLPIQKAQLLKKGSAQWCWDLLEGGAPAFADASARQAVAAENRSGADGAAPSNRIAMEVS
jgi:GxxExxY protein